MLHKTTTNARRPLSSDTGEKEESHGLKPQSHPCFQRSYQHNSACPLHQCMSMQQRFMPKPSATLVQQNEADGDYQRCEIHGTAPGKAYHENNLNALHSCRHNAVSSPKYPSKLSNKHITMPQRHVRPSTAAVEIPNEAGVDGMMYHQCTSLHQRSLLQPSATPVAKTEAGEHLQRCKIHDSPSSYAYAANSLKDLSKTHPHTQQFSDKIVEHPNLIACSGNAVDRSKESFEFRQKNISIPKGHPNDAREDGMTYKNRDFVACNDNANDTVKKLSEHRAKHISRKHMLPVDTALKQEVNLNNTDKDYVACSANSEDTDDDSSEFRRITNKRIDTFLENFRLHRLHMEQRFENKYPLPKNYKSSIKRQSSIETKTRRSSTTSSIKSGEDLRQLVRNQIKVQRWINDSIESLNLKHSDNQPDPVASSLKESKQQSLNPYFLSDCIATDDFTDIVKYKAIGPITRKIQQISINNLREVQKLVDELQDLPVLITELYKKNTSPKK